MVHTLYALILSTILSYSVFFSWRHLYSIARQRFVFSEPDFIRGKVREKHLDKNKDGGPSDFSGHFRLQKIIRSKQPIICYAQELMLPDSCFAAFVSLSPPHYKVACFGKLLSRVLLTYSHCAVVIDYQWHPLCTSPDECVFPTQPLARSRHAAASIHDSMFIFGGEGTHTRADEENVCLSRTCVSFFQRLWSDRARGVTAYVVNLARIGVVEKYTFCVLDFCNFPQTTYI